MVKRNLACEFITVGMGSSEIPKTNSRKSISPEPSRSAGGAEAPAAQVLPCSGTPGHQREGSRSAPKNANSFSVYGEQKTLYRGSWRLKISGWVEGEIQCVDGGMQPAGWEGKKGSWEGGGEGGG